MKLGYFTMPSHPMGRNYAETLAEDQESFILADRLGYTEGHCGEHLTDEIENIPNSMMFLASLQRVTKQIKLGTAVVNLPHAHPVVVASNAAMLDNLLEGRFLMGIGAGIHRSDAEALGLLDENRNAMFAEAIDHVVALWTGQAPYDLSGKYWTISTGKTQWPEIGLGSIVKPYQKPHPPILGTASDPNSKGLIALGRRGWWPVSSNFLHRTRISSQWVNYKQGCEEAGRAAEPDHWRIARSIFVADDDKAAAEYVKAPRSPYRFYYDMLGAKLRKIRHLGAFKTDDAMPDEDVTTDYILDNIVISGGVSAVVDQILALREATGDFGTLLYCGKNWSDKQLSRRSMELMAEKVMPAVNAALGKARAAE